MIRTSWASVAAFGILAIISPAHAAVTIDSATVFTRASAIIITDRPHIDENENQATLTPGNHVFSTGVTVSNQDASGNRAKAQEQISSIFDNPQSGVVKFGGYTQSSVGGGSSIAEAYNSGSSFDYDFTLTSSYTLTLDYALAETDSVYPDNYFQVINLLGGPPLVSGSPADGTYANPDFGTVSIDLSPGSYELGIVTQLGDISGVQGQGSSVGFHTDIYGFHLSAVPEPATWSMMLVGFCLVGGMVRRRTVNASLHFV